VVGAVDPEQVRAAAVRWFGGVPRSSYERAVPAAPPPLPAVRRRAIERPERQASLGLAWIGPALGQEDMASVDVLAYILGGSRSSRLNQALRERARLVSGVTASYSALQSGGILTVTAQFEPFDEAKVEAAILDEIGKIQETGIATRELERAITASEADRVFSEETAEGLALAYGRAETIWSIGEDRRYLDRIRAATAAQVQAAARRYLGAPHARLILRPRGGPE
jgi:predicted Zn-dependent peptidase